MMLKPLLDVGEPTAEIHIHCPAREEDFGLLAIASTLVSDHRARAILYLDDPRGFAERHSDALRGIIEHYGLNSYLLTDKADSDGGVRLVLDGRMVEVDEVHQDEVHVAAWLAIASSPVLKELRSHLPACVLSYVASVTEWANSVIKSKG